MKHDIGVQINIKPDADHDWVLFMSDHKQNFIIGVGKEEWPTRIMLTREQMEQAYAWLTIRLQENLHP